MNDHPITIEMLEEGHLLLLGTTGAGKTYQQRGFLERLRYNGRRVGAVDKLGNHWGLTLSLDGKAAGFDFVIFGGKRAHVPMTPLDGERLGRLFVERNIPAIFDVSQWKSDEQLEWMEAFADAVFLHNDGPLHLGLDEAQSWVPQGGGGDAFRSVLRLAEQGRGNGIRLMMAAQRLSRIDKSAAGMASVVVAMRQTGTADRKAMRDLLAADADQMAMIERDLPGLPTGTGFVWDPLRGTLQAHAFPANMTFDSSRTPRHGDAPPAAIPAASDLVEELRGLLMPAGAAPASAGYPDDTIPVDPAEAWEKGSAIGSMLQERDDRIADLERANGLLEETARELGRQRDDLLGLPERISSLAGRFINDLQALIEGEPKRRVDDLGSVQDARKMSMDGPQRTGETGAKRTAAERVVTAGETAPTSQRELRSLAVLAAIYPAGLSEAAWAGRAGRSRKGGAWASQRKRYVDAGLTEKRDGRWFATADGVIAAAGAVPTLPRPGADLIAWWASRLGASGKLLLTLQDHVGGLSRIELAHLVRMTAKGGAFSGAVAELKRNELIVERDRRLRISPSLTGETSHG
ncbi:hypothetical protein M527_07255 [Sphingobium indicum IP26]|uniref:Uncharacterized protein n=1 Tax=Sphingobium indicum F2 TaxID=1450518 RepID=A0A8E0WSX0_9SPHN|nr:MULTISPECIES: ATP-binding protein [Sphingobium]EPR09914.1 hypothetical protein M527_07255 [Sphingobium indicum IP26]EQB05042.1 hypothetical protein L286_09770 [Sphingobium sp. HDIP04]KER36706.1 hypothetical protein AL00_09550 [Sphingobium indicum F2]